MCINCRGQKYKTQTHKDGGRTPKWSECFSYKLEGKPCLFIEVWDHEKLTHNKLIATGEFNLNKLSIGNSSQWIELEYNKKYAGKILLELIYEPALNQHSSVGYTTNQQQYPIYPQQASHMQSDAYMGLQPRTYMGTQQSPHIGMQQPAMYPSTYPSFQTNTYTGSPQTYDPIPIVHDSLFKMVKIICFKEKFKYPFFI